MRVHWKLPVAAGVLSLAATVPFMAMAQSASAPSFFTADQAARGEAAYDHSCLACHGEHLDDGDFGGPPLRGSYFRNHWGGGDVAAPFAFMKTAMPPDNPGSLTDGEYAAILAFILQNNGYKPGVDELPTDPDAQKKLKLGVAG